MTVRIASSKDIPAEPMPGRTLQWLATPETLGTERLGLAIMDCAPGSVVRPLHAHRDTEEILLILGGQGEAWVDGETAPFRKGDVVLFPANSKHMVRNTGSQPLVAAAIFSPPTSAESYVLFDDSEGW